MDKQKQQAIVRDVQALRRKADALIVVGIMPGGDIFRSVDPRLTIPDLHRTLHDSVDFICECVARERQQQKGNK
jgi:hypothetical protein